MHDAIRATLLAKVYDIARETPLERAGKLSHLLLNDIYLKREDLQPVHSFKLRGAYNKMVQLPKSQLERGVLAVSAGNHAQGVALSAQRLNIAATIVMPVTTPSIKVEAVQGYGAEVILSGDNLSEAFAVGNELAESKGLTFIHPFDDPLIIAGQGTIGREILEQLPDTDYIFVPVGGGGLISGIAQYVKNLMPEVMIIGVEPVDSNAMQISLESGKPVTLPHVGTFADGVAVKTVGSLTFELCRQYVDEVITVDNDQICAAIKDIFVATRTIAEPAGALSVAGAKAYVSQHALSAKRIVTIVSGANITFEKLQFIAERTLMGSAEEALFEITLPETPGALTRLCSDVISGHNISEFCYRMSHRDTAHILVGVGIRGSKDKAEFELKLHRQNYEYQDMSHDDIAKEHVRHMIGGPGVNVRNERLYEVSFPERPRALSDFLAALGDHYNISLFHYRGQGGDTGKVLIGFEAQDSLKLEELLEKAGYEYLPVTSASRLFLSSQQ